MKRERHVIIKTESGEIQIVALPQGSRHSHQIAVAPEGFRPGDEAFVKFIKDSGGRQHLLFDFHGHWSKANKPEAQTEEKPQSVLERLKSGYLA